jgi:transposase, IS30 family
VAGRLTLAEREEIACGRSRGESMRSIAARLGRAPSTISREIAAFSFESWGAPYRAVIAHRSAGRLARRPRRARLARGGRGPRALVLAKLRERWSPAQIAAWLRREFPRDPGSWVSHETIYQAVYLQARGNLRAELAAQKALRSGRTRRRASVPGGALRSGRPWLGLHISQRPAEADDRAVPGHWEGDLILGARHASAIATLVERTSRFVLLVALPDGRVSAHVVAQLAAKMSTLPQALRRSLAWDQGSEMAAHAQFSVATDCLVYFCDPHSPWQRGSNENTNGLLRDYFPKGSDLRPFTQADLDAVADQMNNRPRMTLNWQTPAEVLNEHLVASTT